MHVETLTKEEVSHLMSKAVGETHKNGYTLAGTIFWLEEYGMQEAIPRRSVIKSWRTEKQHMLLNAFVAGNYDMSSSEVSEFIKGVIN